VLEGGLAGESISGASLSERMPNPRRGGRAAGSGGRSTASAGLGAGGFGSRFRVLAREAGLLGGLAFLASRSRGFFGAAAAS
jgi:hypothetical protein